MSGWGQRYVVDTNTLGQIGRRRRRSNFFLDNAVLPEEVIREAAGFSDISALKELLYPTSRSVLQWLVEIMETVMPSDSTLIDLYRNKGAADPLLVACALDGQSNDSAFLDAPEWIVVTADRAARHKAAEFGLTVIGNEEFAALIDASLATDDCTKSETSSSLREHAVCSRCRAQCRPEPRSSSRGFRIAFVCSQHGVVSEIDSFADIG